MANTSRSANMCDQVDCPAKTPAKHRHQTQPSSFIRQSFVRQSLNTTRITLGAALVSAVALIASFGAQPAHADGVVVFGGNGRLTVQTSGFGISIGSPHPGHTYGHPYSITRRFPQTVYNTTTYSLNGGQSTLVITNPQVYHHPNSYGYPGVVIQTHPGTVTPSYPSTLIQNTRIIRRGDPRPVNVAPLNP